MGILISSNIPKSKFKWVIKLKLRVIKDVGDKQRLKP